MAVDRAEVVLDHFTLVKYCTDLLQRSISK